MQEETKKNPFNFVQLSVSRLEEMLDQASTLGAMNALKMAGIGYNEFKTRSQLERAHGKHQVTLAIRAGLTPHLYGKRVKYSEIEFQKMTIR